MSSEPARRRKRKRRMRRRGVYLRSGRLADVHYILTCSNTMRVKTVVCVK